MILSNSRRHFRRYREIAGVFARHGWGWMLDSIGVGEHVKKDEAAEENREPAPAHVREVFEELGPTFVKLGQLLSTRPDLVPEQYVEEFAKLQDSAPRLPFEDIKDVIESEFDAPLKDIYSDFDETPLAAASLAQVHSAKLSDGTSVIVKVQRPNVREQVETDIEILYKRAKFLEGHWDKARTYGILDMVDEFAMTIREELDYTREARNTDRLREAMTAEQGIHVPRVYWNLTSGRVLTLEKVSGVKITDLPKHPVPEVGPVELSRRFASAFLRQVFVDGFFHADPHPGNVLVSQRGEIQLVDCGQVGRLDASARAGAIRLLIAFEQQDTRVFADEVIDLGIASDDIDIPRFTQDLGKVLRSYYDMPSSSVNMGRLLTRVLAVSAEHEIRLPSSFAVLGKVFANVDGICRQLDPDFNFTRISREYIGKAVKQELRSEGVLTDLYRAAAGLRTFLFGLPEQLDRLVRKAVEGTLRVEFKHQNLEGLSDSLRASANRIAVALITGAIIVGSSLVVVAGRGPTSLFGLPTLGVIGYVVATFFGIWLIVSIIRSGRQR